jgi:aminocarboxymuconate-semialdehyde decarboxylase
MDVTRFNLIATVGFCFDTTLAVARMLYSGFFQRYPRLQLIAAHAGGALPYLAGRLDAWFDKVPDCHEFIDVAPSDVMRSIWFDAVTYRADALQLCVGIAGADRVLYGSDYPHNTGDMSGCLARVDALGGSAARRIRGENAQRLFGL